MELYIFCDPDVMGIASGYLYIYICTIIYSQNICICEAKNVPMVENVYPRYHGVRFIVFESVNK